MICHVSDVYVRTGLISVLHNMIYFFMQVHVILIGSLNHKNIY
jgi:hypothetical protein